ncbi:MAG: xanthine dehydrogenase family protein subunit M [Chloroflexota bacterium]
MRFHYLEPRTAAEAISLLEQWGDQARVMAGGTDLMMQMRNRIVCPDQVVDITYIPGLDYIDYDDRRGLRVGALTTIRSLETSSLIRQRYPVISQAASQLGSSAIRNVATVGGNLCNAAPSADMAPALIALSARARILSRAGERTVSLESFFTGPGSTVLRTGELLIEILVPPLPPGARAVYRKHTIRGSVEPAIAGVAAMVTAGRGRVCQDIRIVLGAVAGTPLRAQNAEDALRGKPLEETLISQGAQLAAQEARPISDVRASAGYRREMVRVLTGRAIKEAMLQ